MLDNTTMKPLHVSTDGNAGPYVMVPVQQLDEVCALLDSHQVFYWVDEEAISIDGEPEIAIVNLGANVDAETVQSLLDNAS